MLSHAFIKSKSIMNTSNGLSIKYVYLVRNEARYLSFEGCLYGLVCFYNKCALIKVALQVNSDVYSTPTNFAVPKIRFVPYSVKHIGSVGIYGT